MNQIVLANIEKYLMTEHIMNRKNLGGISRGTIYDNSFIGKNTLKKLLLRFSLFIHR